MTRRSIGTLAAVLVLAGCGSEAGPPVPTVDYTSASSLAHALDRGGFACTSYQQNRDVIGAREDGACDHGSTRVSITTYNSPEQMQQINEAFKAFQSGVPVQGDAWQVSVSDRAEAEQVRKILGGQVK